MRGPVDPLVRRLTLVAMVAVLCCAAEARAAQKSVLLLFGMRPDARIAVLGDRDMPRMLEEGLGQRVNHFAEHLDLARFGDPQYHAALTDFLRLKYAGQRFDLVIAMHEMVVEFLDTTGKTLFPDTPIVFFSNTSDTRRPDNSTGLIADTNFAAALTFASTLQPSLKRVYVIAGADARDKAFEERARPQLRTFEPRLTVTYLSGLTTPDLKNRLSTLPADSIAYYLLVNRDGAGDRVHPLEYLRDIAPSASVPIYSWVDSTVGQGALGGSLKSQEKQTRVVVDLALRVLRGEHPATIPVTSTDLQVNQVDWRQLERWGISESRLPPGTLVLFKEATLWQRYKLYVLVALSLVLAQTALIAALLVQRVRRRQAEEEARGSQLKLQTSHDRIRSLGSRLLNAQETERARIARELHDDVSQQLALLATDLELLRRSAPRDTPALAAQAWDRTQTVARSVHDLAYRLYPAKLRLIGLVPALQALQREMERSIIVMNLVHENVPRNLPPDVTLCVFRVAQEALQNALKHSAAREVSLAVVGMPNGLTLTIADDGIGFDVSPAWGKGLGLVSMSERIEALNGTIQIYSTPGAGTRLVITVPLAASERVVASAG